MMSVKDPRDKNLFFPTVYNEYDLAKSLEKSLAHYALKQSLATISPLSGLMQVRKGIMVKGS